MVAKSEDKGSRKRRPSSPASKTPTKKVAINSPVKKNPVIIDYGPIEEKEAKNRSASHDSKLFENTCTQMKDILSQVLKSSKSSDVSELKNDFLMHFLSLKKLNRLDKLRTKNCRDATLESKAKVDNFHLQLENLKYEVLHLQKEVTKCLKYKSLDEEIDLVPVEEFYKNAPAEISENTQENQHLQRLARLEYEKLQREKQNEEFQKLENEKEALENHINKKRENLANLKPQLSNILKATEPVQNFLKMPLNQEKNQLELAKFLPNPLFVVFSEIRAFAQACDQNVQVEIEGDLEEAKAEFAANLRKRMATTGDNLQDENDEEQEDDEENESKKSKKKKKNIEEKTKKLKSLHPLRVQIQVKLPDSENAVCLTFGFYVELEVVNVKTKLILDGEAKAFTGDRQVLQASTLLANLLTANDDGLTCPNPSFAYILKKNCVENLTDLGFMFYWAQNLCGLKFPAKTETEFEDEMSNFVEKVVESIRSRLKSRIYLQREISQLEKSKLISVDLDVPKSLSSQFPSKISSILGAWTSVNWEQYVALDVTKHLVESGAVDSNDFLFRLQINRDSAASLIALIAIKPDHPFSPPVFCLNLHWNGEHNLHNSEYIRFLERDVNFGFVHLLEQKGEEKFEILALQIKKLLSSCDVLLESWQLQGEDKQDFTREKMFLHTVRGKRRLPPLKYDSCSQIFSQ